MQLKSGYKQSEVGVIPEDWEVTPLGELGEFKNGINKAKEDFGHGFPFVNLMDVFGKPLISNDVNLELVNSSIFDRKNCDLIAGDVLFVRSSVKPSGVGLTTLVSADLFNVVFSGFLIRYRDYGNLALEYKRHCFFDFGFRTRLISGSSVSANTNVNQHTLKSLLISYPKDKDEQRAIAAALDDVAALIVALDALIAKKRDLKIAAMQQLLTGKKRLAGFSGDWVVENFGNIASPRKQRVNPLRLSERPFCIELEDIEQNTGKLTVRSLGEQSSLKSSFFAGDVLFGKLRAYLRKYWLADRDGICSTEIWPLVPKSELVTSAYLLQIVKSDGFIEAANLSYGTHMPRSEWKSVAKFEVQLPQLEEQIAMAEVLSDMDAEIAALEAKRDKTRDLKRGMMQELLTGRTRLMPTNSNSLT